MRHGALKGNKDFEALGSLLETLNRIASVELKNSRADAPIGGIDLAEILDDLRIVLFQAVRELLTNALLASCETARVTSAPSCK